MMNLQDAEEAEQGPSRKREIPKSLFSSRRTWFRAFGLSRLNFPGVLRVLCFLRDFAVIQKSLL